MKQQGYLHWAVLEKCGLNTSATIYKLFEIQIVSYYSSLSEVRASSVYGKVHTIYNACIFMLFTTSLLYIYEIFVVVLLLPV